MDQNIDLLRVFSSTYDAHCLTPCQLPSHPSQNCMTNGRFRKIVTTKWVDLMSLSTYCGNDGGGIDERFASCKILSKVNIYLKICRMLDVAEIPLLDPG